MPLCPFFHPQFAIPPLCQLALHKKCMRHWGLLRLIQPRVHGHGETWMRYSTHCCKYPISLSHCLHYRHNVHLGGYHVPSQKFPWYLWKQTAKLLFCYLNPIRQIIKADLFWKKSKYNLPPLPWLVQATSTTTVFWGALYSLIITYDCIVVFNIVSLFIFFDVGCILLLSSLEKAVYKYFNKFR